MSSTMKLAKVLDELDIEQSLAECLLMVWLPGDSWMHAEMRSSLAGLNRRHRRVCHVAAHRCARVAKSLPGGRI